MRIAILLVLAGCQFPAPSERASCALDGECADGQVCVNDQCVPAPRGCTLAVSAGDEHTCAIREDHTAWCWGRNSFGQLGDGSKEDRAAPVAVGGTMKFLAIAAGNDHTCAIRDDKSAWCWGSNANAQLGGPAASVTPAPVEAVPGFSAIVTGRAHTCGLRENGVVSCWGFNDFGQLGNGNRTVSRTPVEVQNLVATEIAAGGDATCAIDRDQALWCWGDNGAGQLGVGDRMPHLVPTKATVAAATHVAMGSGFMCALTMAGEVHCAGSNSHFQLADGNPSMDHATPVKVRVSVAFDAITAGNRFACAIERADAGHPTPRPWCWGEGTDFQFGDDIGDNHADPAPTLVRGIVAADGGGAHLCVLSAEGALACSGDASRGQLGDGRRTTQSRPQAPLAGLPRADAIAAGETHTCALAGNSIYCWGRNSVGELGDGTRVARTTPVRVELPPAVSVSAGDDHTCAVLTDRHVACWGGNSTRQLGTNTGDRSLAQLVPDGAGLVEGAVQVVAGRHHSCAVIEVSGERFAKCWGMNERGQCGGGTAGADSPPVRVMNLTNVSEIAIGERHTCALRGDGKVLCWGANAFGELGKGVAATDPNDFSLQPLVVDGVSGAVHIATRNTTTCAALGGGTVLCWGEASGGLIGDGNFGPIRSPPMFAVMGLVDAEHIAMGLGHACASGPSGVKCWGSGAFGQLGNGDYLGAGTAVAAGLAGAKDVAAGGQHTCALTSNGVACWGDDRDGQLGDGVSTRRTAVAPMLPCP